MMRLRWRQARRHQERRPVQRVLPHDLLAKQVRGHRPESLASRPSSGVRLWADLIVRSKPKHRQVVRQRIERDIHHVLRIVRYGNPHENEVRLTPRFCSPASTKGALSRRAGNPRLQKLRIGGVEIQQRLLILPEAGSNSSLPSAARPCCRTSDTSRQPAAFREQRFRRRCMTILRSLPCRCLPVRGNAAPDSLCGSGGDAARSSG